MFLRVVINGDVNYIYYNKKKKKVIYNEKSRV